MLSRLRHWSQSALSFLPAAIPSCCAICGCSPRHSVCDGCRQQFFAQQPHRCRRCGIPLASLSDLECGDCLKHPPAFDATIVARDYSPPVDQLVLALKFGKRLELASLFSEMLVEAINNRGRDSENIELLTPVPLGARRLTERGFNQALEIAKPLARALGTHLDAKLLLRQRETQAQALLHPDERQRNIRHAFIVAGNAIDLVRDRHIGVVDDVMTTGVTLQEVAATLKRFGARRVTNIVFARTAQY